MSRDASIATASVASEHARNTEEASAMKAFLLIVALVIAAAVVLGFTFGLAGIGALAILMAAAMLVVCVLLTAG